MDFLIVKFLQIELSILNQEKIAIILLTYQTWEDSFLNGYCTNYTDDIILSSVRSKMPNSAEAPIYLIFYML
ncbi:hypothetical protein BFP75_18750 [Maribacter sp. 4G9]|nr:hypothetical protein BFP75_18750 [Maribacter sp. 4G9]